MSQPRGSQTGLKNSRPLHQSVTELPCPRPKVAAPCSLLSGCHTEYQIPNSPSPRSAVPMALLKQKSLNSVAGRPRSHSLNTQAHGRLRGLLPLPHRGVGVGGGAGSFPEDATWQAWGWGWGSACVCCVTSGLSRSHHCLQASSRRPQEVGRARPVHRGSVWPPEHALLHSKWWVWIIHFLGFSRPLLHPSEFFFFPLGSL